MYRTHVQLQQFGRLAPVGLRFRTYDVKLDSVWQDYADMVLALPAMQKWLNSAISEPEVMPTFESR
ncbi:hypothetical protein NC981_14440 [Leptolyngbya sp. DQ-M1]|uniref:hypothetical protein n=1 Tax=Leptolyngbya sp. DQ-M1 TaxID=2933920 RepID=UPI003296C026